MSATQSEEWQEMCRILADAHNMLDQRDTLIRELVAALEQIAEADQELTNCWSAAEAFHWCNSRAEVALAKAKAQGFEP